MARAESLKRKRRARYERKQGSHPTRQKVYMGLCLVQRRQTAQGQLLNMKSSFRRKLWLSNQKAGSFAPFAPSVKMFGWISMTHQRIEGLGHPGDHYGDYGQEDIIGSMLGKKPSISMENMEVCFRSTTNHGFTSETIQVYSE